MKDKVFLIHWNEAEAEAHAAALRSQGWEVTVEAQDSGRASRLIKAAPPGVPLSKAIPSAPGTSGSNTGL